MKQMKTLLVVSLLLACVFVPGFAAADGETITNADNKTETETTTVSSSGGSGGSSSGADYKIKSPTDVTNETETTATSSGGSGEGVSATSVTQGEVQSTETAIGISKVVRKPQVVKPHVIRPVVARVRYMDIKDRQLNSRQALVDARREIMNAETPEERAELVVELKTAAKEHLLQTIDRMIGRLEVVQEQIEAAEENDDAPEGASDNIDRYILRLEGKKSEVESADTGADIVSAAKDIRGEWREIRREILRHTRYMIVARIGNYVEKSERLSDKLDTQIDALDDQGVDTTNLKDKLDRFDDKIDCVETNYLLARDGIGDGDPADVRQAVREANVCIRDANQIIREIFRELREYRAGTVVLKGTGTLTAEGSGTALVRGNIEIALAADAGSLSVRDRAGDMAIEVTGDGTRTEDGSTVIYTGFNGDATIAGSNVVVTMTGTGIDLTVDGTGTAILIGTGSYEVTHGDEDVASGVWRNPDLTGVEPVVLSGTAVESEVTVEDGDDGESDADTGDDTGDESESGNETGDVNETADTGEEV
ncbi:MAG: hypothetical protein J7J06_05045 [Methanosarcinales archaeon]|nr:hypothetical protein [Methanosarcinales archaeon]